MVCYAMLCFGYAWLYLAGLAELSFTLISRLAPPPLQNKPRKVQSDPIATASKTCPFQAHLRGWSRLGPKINKSSTNIRENHNKTSLYDGTILGEPREIVHACWFSVETVDKALKKEWRARSIVKIPVSTILVLFFSSLIFVMHLPRQMYMHTYISQERDERASRLLFRASVCDLDSGWLNMFYVNVRMFFASHWALSTRRFVSIRCACHESYHQLKCLLNFMTLSVASLSSPPR